MALLGIFVCFDNFELDANISKLHDSLTPYIGNWLAINNRHGSLRKFAVNEVNARKDRGSDRRDLLSKFMAVHEAKPEAFDESAIMSMASSNIFAGSDTTAISTRAVIYHLLKNPQYKQTLIDECETARGAGKLSDPVKFEEANDMPYLQAVLYETTRVHPATGMGMPRVVPPGGFEVQGRFLPAGVSSKSTSVANWINLLTLTYRRLLVRTPGHLTETRLYLAKTQIASTQNDG